MRPVKWAVLPVWADEQGVGTLVGFVIPGAADVGHGEGGDGASDVADGEVAVDRGPCSISCRRML